MDYGALEEAGELELLRAELRAAWATTMGVAMSAVSVQLEAGSLVMEVRVQFEGAASAARAAEAQEAVADLSAVANSVRQSPRLANAMGLPDGTEATAEGLAGLVRVERNEEQNVNAAPSGVEASNGKQRGEGGKLGVGVFAGIAVGGLAATAVAVGLLIRRRRRRRADALEARRLLRMSQNFMGTLPFTSFHDMSEVGGNGAGAPRDLAMSVFNPLHEIGD